jgi:hypothetical protein
MNINPKTGKPYADRRDPESQRRKAAENDALKFRACDRLGIRRNNVKGQGGWVDLPLETRKAELVNQRRIDAEVPPHLSPALIGRAKSGVPTVEAAAMPAANESIARRYAELDAQRRPVVVTSTS